MQQQKYHISLLIVVLGVAVWSLIEPAGLLIWFLESFAVIFALPLLVLTYRRFPLTSLVYTLIAIHSFILLVGAHYTYAEVPLFNWLRDEYGLSRNYYDRVGHFAQGFVPAMIGRELLIRTSSLNRGKWMIALLLLSCLGISALYELLEWLVASFSEEEGTAFLATQGDIWDTQKDMFLAGIGAATALISLSRMHDRQLRNL